MSAQRHTLSAILSIMSEPMRTAVARLWHACAQIDRSEFFGVEDESKWRPLYLRQEAATMTIGYLGSRYRSGSDILLIGINPGGGGDAHVHRDPHDERLYPALMSFKQAADTDVLAAFDHLQETYPSAIRAWPLYTVVYPILDAVGRSLDRITLVNVVPYRTRNDKPPPAQAKRLGWEIVEHTLGHLKPRAIVTLGAAAGNVVNSLYTGDLSAYCVPRMRGDRGVTPQAREVISHLRAAARNW